MGGRPAQKRGGLRTSLLAQLFSCQRTPRRPTCPSLRPDRPTPHAERPRRGHACRFSRALPASLNAPAWPSQNAIAVSRGAPGATALSLAVTRRTGWRQAGSLRRRRRAPPKAAQLPVSPERKPALGTGASAPTLPGTSSRSAQPPFACCGPAARIILWRHPLSCCTRRHRRHCTAIPSAPAAPSGAATPSYTLPQPRRP